MNWLRVPFVFHWSGDPKPDLSGFIEPVRVPFRFAPHPSEGDGLARARDDSSNELYTPAQWWRPLLSEEPPFIVRPPLPEYPKSPSEPPRPEWEWRGRPGSRPGDPKGGWWNPKTKETLHPDLDYGEPVGPHWDYRTPGRGDTYRWFPDGRLEPKLL